MNNYKNGDRVILTYHSGTSLPNLEETVVLLSDSYKDAHGIVKAIVYMVKPDNDFTNPMEYMLENGNVITSKLDSVHMIKEEFTNE